MKRSITSHENSKKWNELMENSYIAINIVFNENTPIAINELISEAFSLNAENNWIILNSSINKLILVTSQVMTNQNDTFTAL